jgi:hypothetical protein
LARESALRSLDALMADYRDRIIPPVMAFAATKLLLQLELPPSLPSQLNAVCRGLARHAALLAGIDVPPDEETPIAKQAPSARGDAPPASGESQATAHA